MVTRLTHLLSKHDGTRFVVLQQYRGRLIEQVAVAEAKNRSIRNEIGQKTGQANFLWNFIFRMWGTGQLPNLDLLIPLEIARLKMSSGNAITESTDFALNERFLIPKENGQDDLTKISCHADEANSHKGPLNSHNYSRAEGPRQSAVFSQCTSLYSAGPVLLDPCSSSRTNATNAGKPGADKSPPPALPEQTNDVGNSF